MKAYQDQLNAGFSKVCEICKVLGIDSLKYVQEFYKPVCYCGDISTPLNMMQHKTNLIDWLFYLYGLLDGPWPLKAAKVPRPSAVSLKVWLCETTGVSEARAVKDPPFSGRGWGVSAHSHLTL